MSQRPEMQSAAVMFLNGIDPVGRAYLSARDPFVREVWHAVGIRASRLVEQAKRA